MDAFFHAVVRYISSIAPKCARKTLLIPIRTQSSSSLFSIYYMSCRELRKPAREGRGLTTTRPDFRCPHHLPAFLCTFDSFASAGCCASPNLPTLQKAKTRNQMSLWHPFRLLPRSLSPAGRQQSTCAFDTPRGTYRGIIRLPAWPLKHLDMVQISMSHFMHGRGFHARWPAVVPCPCRLVSLSMCKATSATKRK